MARNVYICAHAPMRCVSGHFCAGAACTGGPATRDARYRAAERVNVCAGPSSQNSICGQCGTALRAPPAPPVDVKVHKAWRVGRCRGRGRASPLGGGAARARAAPPVVCRGHRTRVSRDWRTHIIRRHAGADRPETRPGHEMYTARDITHPGAAQPRITSSSTRADGHPDDGTEDATRLPDLRGYS